MQRFTNLLIYRYHLNFTRKCSSSTRRRIPKTENEYHQFRDETIAQPNEPLLVRVAIIGSPNVGKSTLLNQLVDWKVSAVSSKVHTTRRNVVGVYNESNTQIEFIDTPGLVNRKHISRHNLDPQLLNDLEDSLTNADIITVLSDVSNERERNNINKGILNMLKKNQDKESILVLNKVDKLKTKRNLLDITFALTSGMVGGQVIRKPINDLKEDIQYENFSKLFKRTEEHYLKYKDENKEEHINDFIGWPNFSRVFMISALCDDGITDLRSYLLNQAKPKPWLYNNNSVTPHKPQKLIFDALRETCLGLYRQEIPYNIHFKIVIWEVDELGNLIIVVDLLCLEKFLSVIIGPKGTTISALVRKSRESLADIFRCDVSLKIAVKSNPYNKK